MIHLVPNGPNFKTLEKLKKKLGPIIEIKDEKFVVECVDDEISVYCYVDPYRMSKFGVKILYSYTDRQIAMDSYYDSLSDV